MNSGLPTLSYLPPTSIVMTDALVPGYPSLLTLGKECCYIQMNLVDKKLQGNITHTFHS